MCLLSTIINGKVSLDRPSLTSGSDHAYGVLGFWSFRVFGVLVFWVFFYLFYFLGGRAPRGGEGRPNYEREAKIIKLAINFEK